MAGGVKRWHGLDALGCYGFSSWLRSDFQQIIKNLDKRATQCVIWLLCRTSGQVIYGGLTTTHAHGDLCLRHFAVALDFGNGKFPVHSPIITGFRYFATDFPLSVYCKV